MKKLILVGGLLLAVTAQAVVPLFLTTRTNAVAILVGGTLQSNLTNYDAATISVNDLVAHGLPFVTVSAAGLANGLATITNNGSAFGPDTPGTLTCGLQEAINSLPRAPNLQSQGGGTLYLSAGNFFTTTNFHTPNTTNPFTLQVRGAGVTSCGITYVGTNSMSVFTVGNAGAVNSYANCNLLMDNLWVASSVNTLTNIIWLNGGSVYQSRSPGIGFAKIKNCYIGYWPSMTNNNCGGFTQSSCADAGKHNLIGIQADGELASVSVTECSFGYCLAIEAASDWLVMENNSFQHCGYTQQAVTNDWPHSSPLSVGATITFPEAYNGNNFWSIRNNVFVNCWVNYMVDDSRVAFMNPMTYDDGAEGAGGSYVVTTGARFYSINARGVGLSYYATNRADYSTWQNNLAPSNMVTLSTVKGTLGGVAAVATNTVPLTAPAFIGSGRFLTNISGFNLSGSGPFIRTITSFDGDNACVSIDQTFGATIHDSTGAVGLRVDPTGVTAAKYYGDGSNLTGVKGSTNETLDLYNVIIGGGNYRGYTPPPAALPPGTNEWRYGYDTYIGGANAMDARNTGTNIALYNVAVGYSALFSIFGTGVNRDLGNPAYLPSGGNTALGLGALYSLTNGQFNTFLGWSSGYQGQGSRNTGLGVMSLYNTTPNGVYNVAVGELALNSDTDGNYNTAVGYQAGQQLTTGIANIFIGAGAGDHVTTGSYNVALGENAGDAWGATDNHNIALGYLSGLGGDVNIARIGNPNFITDTYLAGVAHASVTFASTNGPGASLSLAVQTNSVGPHGLTLSFTNGLYIGATPY